MITLPSWAQELKIYFNARVKGDELFVKSCPFCNNSRWNFQISATKAMYHCWVCHASGSARSLLQKMGIAYDGEIISTWRKKVVNTELKIPDTMSLFSSSRICSIARDYLLSRDVSEEMLTDWQFQVCTGRDEKNFGFDLFGWLFVPFYGLTGLDYYILAKFHDGKGYKLPEGTKDRFVPKRRGSDSLIVVEGLFDGVSAWRHTDFDVQMLFGTYLMKHQTELIEKIGYNKVYICLDGDAWRASLDIVRRLLRVGVQVYWVRLPLDKDPNDLKAELAVYINKAEQMSLAGILREKLCRT